MYDRVIQAIYLITLEPVAEYYADPDSFGFRSYRSAADAIEYCHNYLSRKTSAKWIFEGDITGCFDNISHEWLNENVPWTKGYSGNG